MPPDPERFLAHLSEAVRIRTVTHEDTALADDKPFDAFREFIAVTWPRFWAAAKPEVVAGGSLLFTWTGSDPSRAAIVLLAHQDVVPVEAATAAAWTEPPFDGRRSATHLVGRGALDDKGSLVAILEAVEGLIEDGFRPTRTVHLAFGHTEESTDRPGAEELARTLRDRGVRADLVLDEGGFVTEGAIPMTSRPVALVGVAEKGYLDVELTTHGQTGHSSQPPRHTAVGVLAGAIARLENRPMPARLDAVRDLLDAASAAAPGRSRRALRVLTRLGPLSLRALARQPATNAGIRTTTAATIVEGGVKANVLPAHARAVVNFRIAPWNSVDDVLRHVRRVVGRDVDVRALRAIEPSPVSDRESVGFRLVEDTVAEVFPDAVVAPWVVIGTTDARHYTGISDAVLRFIPFRASPAEIAGFHGIDERVRLADARPAVAFYSRLIERASAS